MYVKLFSSILDSSIWAEDMPTRIVWITMLTMADADGFVRGVPSALARRANVSLPECRKALETLAGPDLESQTQEYAGRRIEAVEGGWLIINYAKYRQLRNAEARRQQWREASKRYRKRHQSSSKADDARLTRVENQPVSAQAEAEAEAEAKNTTTPPPTLDADFARFRAEYPKRAGSNPIKVAKQRFRSRCKDGIDPELLITQARAYRLFCEATGKIGTETVAQMATWLGPNYEGWLQDWTAPSQPDGQDSGMGFDDDDFFTGRSA